MAKAIVIVESPTKVKTINKILGSKFKVVSSMGHLIDLPKSTLGVNIEKDFEPRFIVVRSKSKLLTKLKKDTKSAKEIYVATDPDREGEAIGWNLVQHLGKDKKIYRVTFQEITKEAVLKAFKHPREFDLRKINAQIGRRVLDRIVGYKLSPILWKKVGSRLSAGRVQSVALRLIVERERAIEAFEPREYWQIAVDLQKQGVPGRLEAVLERLDGRKPELTSETETREVIERLKKETFTVSKISERDVRRKPLPPLITSTLQQEAFNKLKFNANKTMMIAQQLYEGIDLGGETVGLITYMRTDSVNISQEALARTRQFIGEVYGDRYLPNKPNVYKSKKSAQEAHEAIRPTDVRRRPQDLKGVLEGDQYKLYTIIWNRFVSSQMTPAVYRHKKMGITAGPFQFGASGSNLVFEGFLALEREDKEEEKLVDFSAYQKGDDLQLVEVKPSQHFTKPPPRFSDASLVKALEEAGIGRPSTYAAIISTLVFRNYVLRNKGYLIPTELGRLICDLLTDYFARIMDVGFTARMEEDLDRIEEGEMNYPQLLKEFYGPFVKELDHAETSIVKAENYVEKTCPDCGRQLVVKWGRRGKFLSCSGFPDCRHAEAFTLGIKCPKEGCSGELVRRKSQRGFFYGCSAYPKCTYVSQDLPKSSNDQKPT